MKCLPILILILSITATAAAQLTPDEVAVLAMANSDQSRRLAEYYAKARGVPETQILLLDGKPGETISRAVWQNEVRPAIRAWLKTKGLETKIRCFVTVWDVPLRIGKQSGDAPEVVAREEFLAQSRARLVEHLAGLVDTLNSLAPGEKSPDEALPDAELPGKQSPDEALPGEDAVEPETPAKDTKLAALTAEYGSAFAAARKRAQNVESEEEKKRLGEVLERVFVTGGGITGLLRLVVQRGDGEILNSERASQLQGLKGQIQGIGQGLRALEGMPATPSRDLQMLGLVQATGGLVGAIQWIDQQREILRKNETYSSFDSELSLLHWPDYPLNRWWPNLLHYRYDNLPMARPATLMVARLEAPTYDLARRLVDTAIATEATGLTGKVYLDARGMGFNPKSDKPGSYGAYDQSVRDLAERLEEHTKLEVVLNNKASLFQEGDCPEAALYCGWYSLAKYVDAFDWRPGAVGYHMASSEATTLRRPGGKVWCNAMLEDGICATLGPVHEPYLASFPLPDDFFSLLLTGRYTLAEVYYRTKPYNSWAMVLVGDPLYNPFKKNPPLSENALPDRMKQKPTATTE